MLGVSMISKIFYVLAIFSSLIHAFPSNFLNFPRQFVQPPPTTSNGENTNPERPSTNLNTRPPLVNTDVFQQPYPQRLTTIPDQGTELYSTADFTSTTPNSDDLSATESNDGDSSSSTTITPFINPNLSGFPINPPGTFPLNTQPTNGGQIPLKPHSRPSISSTLLSTYPQQHVVGAVGPFPVKIQQQEGLVPVIGGGMGAAASLLQLLNPLNLFRPVSDTFQNIGHILSHPNYGPGAALLRPVQFWSAVNAAGNPSLAPFRKLPSNVVVTSNSREK